MILKKTTQFYYFSLFFSEEFSLSHNEFSFFFFFLLSFLTGQDSSFSPFFTGNPHKQTGKLHKQTKQLHFNTNPCQSKSIFSIFRQIWGLTLHFLSHGSSKHSTGASMVAATATLAWGWDWFGFLESVFCWVFFFFLVDFELDLVVVAR